MSNDTKACRTCGTEKALELFPKSPNSRGGRGVHCKACDGARLKARAERIKLTDKVIPASKTCPKCETTKPSGDFGRHNSRVDGLSFYCKSCERESARQRKLDNPELAEKNRDRLRALYADQPRYLDYLYRSKFGISWERYQEILLSQGGMCAICNREPDKQRLSVDHDHGCCPDKSKSCGECVRGLLCSDCNFGLGLFRDKAELLHRAAAYLAT